jgi:hypothetical protein
MGSDGSVGTDVAVAGADVTGLGVVGPDAGVTGALGAVERPGRGGPAEYWTVVTGCRVTRSGASPSPPAPMPPVPVDAPTGAGLRDGVASVQPIAMEIGSPKATSPKKMDLGDNRTP